MQEQARKTCLARYWRYQLNTEKVDERALAAGFPEMKLEDSAENWGKIRLLLKGTDASGPSLHFGNDRDGEGPIHMTICIESNAAAEADKTQASLKERALLVTNAKLASGAPRLLWSYLSAPDIPHSVALEALARALPEFEWRNEPTTRYGSAASANFLGRSPGLKIQIEEGFARKEISFALTADERPDAEIEKLYLELRDRIFAAFLRAAM